MTWGFFLAAMGLIYTATRCKCLGMDKATLKEFREAYVAGYSDPYIGPLTEERAALERMGYLERHPLTDDGEPLWRITMRGETVAMRLFGQVRR